VAAGTSILRDGEHEDRSYIVSNGQVEVVHEDENGQRRTATLGSGQVFETPGRGRAEAGIISARAIQVSELLIVQRDTTKP
jgi:CRP-like cAMP-binding protein